MESIKHESLIEALIAVQNEVSVPKDQYNKFGNYKYRDAESILKAAKPIAMKHGALITLTDTIRYIEGHEKLQTSTDKSSMNLDTDGRFYLVATARFHFGSEKMEVESLAREEITKKGMDSSQVTGAASSYARKYALCGLLGIDDGIDSDATNKSQKQGYQQQEQQPKQPAKQQPKPQAKQQPKQPAKQQPAPAQQPTPGESLGQAKRTLMKAINDYAKATGADATALKMNVTTLPGYDVSNPEFFLETAQTYIDEIGRAHV